MRYRTSVLEIDFTMEKGDIQDLIGELQSCGLEMDEEQLACCHRAACIIEDITAQQCRQVIGEAHRNPVLQVFMSDGWSCDMRQRASASHGDIRVDRSGRLRTEYCLQRSIVKSRKGDQVRMAIKIERPRPLMTKKCADIWSAATDFCPILALAGHKGVGIHVYLQDGLFAKPFGRRMIARHSLFWEPAYCPLTFQCEADRALAELRDWVYFSSCYAHSCSKALKWGMRSLVVAGGEEVLDAVHISVSSLLRASTGLFLVVPEFIVTFVVFDLPELETTDDVEWLWTALDVPPKLMQLFLKVNPQWYGQRLHCSASLGQDLEAVKAVTTVIHFCLHWCDFSETRWTKVGLCGRMFLRSLCIGVDVLVKLAMKHDAVCKWHLGGFGKKCSPAVRNYLAVAALAGRPSEGMLMKLMKDDRFLLHHARCLDILQTEHRYVETGPEYAYSRISAILNVDCDWYRTSVLESSLTSISYLHMDCFASLSTAPLKYTVGNVVANIECLKGEEGITDALTLKWQQLAELGYESEVVAGIELLKESSFTTIIVEQAHASGSLIMKRHTQLNTESLLARMTVHNCRMLFCDSHLEKQLSHLNSLLDRINKQQGNVHSTGAREMYIKALIAEAKKDREQGGPSHNALRLSIFKHHAKPFGQLGPGHVAALNLRASVYNKNKIDTLDESRVHVQEQIQTLMAKDAEVRQHGKTNHMDTIRFGACEFQRFGELWPQFSDKDCQGRVKAAPNGIPHAMAALLAEMEERVFVQKPQQPDWVSKMVDLRDHFALCGFYADSTHPCATVAYKLLLSIAQPRRLVFLECRRRPFRVSGMVAYGSYEYEAFRIVNHTQVPWQNSSDIWVLPEMRVLGSTVVTFGEALPWITFTRHLKLTALNTRAQGAGGSGPRVKVDEETLRLLQLEFPWLSLQELLEILKQKLAPQAGGAQGAAGGSSAGGAARVAGAEPPPTPPEMPEDIAARVLDELEVIRAEVAGCQHEGIQYFRLRVLGGPWSVRLKRTLTTDFGSYAKDKSVSKWCDKTGFPVRKSFATNHYGNANARMLAEEVQRRGNYFFSAWVTADCIVPFDFAAAAAVYSAPQEYHTWFDALPMASYSSQAAFQITNLVLRPMTEE